MVGVSAVGKKSVGQSTVRQKMYKYKYTFKVLLLSQGNPGVLLATGKDLNDFY